MRSPDLAGMVAWLRSLDPDQPVHRTGIIISTSCVAAQYATHLGYPRASVGLEQRGSDHRVLYSLRYDDGWRDTYHPLSEVFSEAIDHIDGYDRGQALTAGQVLTLLEESGVLSVNGIGS